MFEPESIVRLEKCGLDILPNLTGLRTDGLSLEGNRFRFIQPQNLPTRLKYLSLKRNSLTSANIFHQIVYPSIETLILDNNYIHGIYDLAFSAPNLKTLSLTVNSIHRIDTVTEFNHLENLYISYNYIEVLDSIPKTLKTLTVGSCKLRMVQSRMPLGLEKINLSSNLLKFAGLPFHWGNSLRELNLSFNKLQKFPRKLPDTLEVLYIQDNHISELPDTLPTSLRILIASDNKILKIPQYRLVKRMELFNITYNKVTDLTHGEAISTVFIADHNWNKTIHSSVVNRIIKLWRRYCLQLRLRSIVRTQRLRNSLLEVAMCPSRLGLFEPMPQGWNDS
jgi:Leucine-rich repeat (LRR) protein